MSAHRPLAEAKSLIVAAFEQARERGVPDWQTMNAGVLKNRVLQKTGRSFSEADFGFGSFSALLDALAEEEVLTVDRSAKPALATLRDRTVGELTTDQRRRIRPDLWRAVTNWEAAGTWVWDADRAVARPAEPGSTDARLPGIDQDGDRRWRTEFIASLDPALVEAAGPALSEWEERQLSMIRLPDYLRAKWSDFQVAKVEELLIEWFASQRLEPPDLFASGPVIASRTEELRRALHRIVDQMTLQELEGLNVPLAAHVRASSASRRPRRD